MSEGVILLVVVVIAVIIAIGVAVGMAQRRRLAERRSELATLATAHEWTFVAENRGYAKRWDGPPFTRGGTTRNILSGHHRGRPIAAFEYTYTTSTYNGTTTVTQTHVFSVWTIELPGPVPTMSVAAEGAFGGKVAEAFGFARVDTGDPVFDDLFKVKADDEEFARSVLAPAVVERLKATGPWTWRFTGTTMLAHEPIILTPEAVLGRLERMSDLLDLVPDQVWRRRSAGR